MPWEWVEPKVFLDSSNGAGTVYHCYDEDYRVKWRYQIREERFDSGFTAFDIRNLAAEMNQERRAGQTHQEHKSLILLACSEKPLVEWLAGIGYEGETR